LAATVAVAIIVPADAAARPVERLLPAPRIVAHPRAETNATTARFTFVRRKATSYVCRLDARPFRVCASPVRFAKLREGFHVFQLRARTSRGRKSKLSRFAWRVDLTRPTPVLTRTPAAATPSSDAEFAFRVPEVAVVGCALDSDVFEPCADSRSYNGLAEGRHLFAVRARDAAGNTSTTSYSWIVDRTPPPAPIFASVPADPSNSRTATFGFSAGDAVGYSCSLDQAPFVPCASPHVQPGIAEGAHDFAVKARDAAGNEGPPRAYSWRTDYTPPTAPVIVETPRSTSFVRNPSIAFTSTDEPGVAVRCRLEPAAFAPCSSPQQYTAVPLGEQAFEVQAVDPAGNESRARFGWTVLERGDGVFRGPGPSGVREFEAWRGRPAQHVLEYLAKGTWADIEGVGASNIVSWNGTRYRLVVSTPMLPETGATLAEGATGAYNVHFRKLAEFLIENGQSNAVIRLGWEFNGDWYAWSAKEDPASFIAFWRQVVDTMRGVPGARFEFDWCANRGDNGMEAKDGYPGDAWVDYIGVSTFDAAWGVGDHGTPEGRWRMLREQVNGLEWQRDFAEAHGKPMSFPEWGLWEFRIDWYSIGGTDGRDDPYYIERMHEWLEANDVAYALYFEWDSPEGFHRLMTGRFPNGTAKYLQLFGA
jgi:hypothetical protein